MKYFLLTFFLITSVSVGEIKPGNYKLSDFSEIDKDSILYPAVMFIKHFKDGKPYLAVNYCTEEAVYDDDPWLDNFYYKFKEQLYKIDLSDTSKVLVAINVREGSDYIYLKIPTVDGKTVRIRFLINQVIGKTLITKII